MLYDHAGREVERTFFDAAGRPATHRDGHAKVTHRYGNLGELLETIYFDQAGRRMKSVSGAKP